MCDGENSESAAPEHHRKKKKSKDQPKLRLLCLHNEGQSKDVFERQVEAFFRVDLGMRSWVDPHYLEAPLQMANAETEAASQMKCVLFGGDPHCWHRYEKRGYPGESWPGFEASFTGVADHISAQGPGYYDGILGFGQGASVAAQIARIAEAPGSPLADHFRFVLLFSGVWPRERSLRPKAPLKVPVWCAFERQGRIPQADYEALPVYWDEDSREVLSHEQGLKLPVLEGIGLTRLRNFLTLFLPSDMEEESSETDEEHENRLEMTRPSQGSKRYLASTISSHTGAGLSLESVDIGSGSLPILNRAKPDLTLIRGSRTIAVCFHDLTPLPTILGLGGLAAEEGANTAVRGGSAPSIHRKQVVTGTPRDFDSFAQKVSKTKDFKNRLALDVPDLERFVNVPELDAGQGLPISESDERLVTEGLSKLLARPYDGFEVIIIGVGFGAYVALRYAERIEAMFREEGSDRSVWQVVVVRPPSNFPPLRPRSLGAAPIDCYIEDTWTGGGIWRTELAGGGPFSIRILGPEDCWEDIVLGKLRPAYENSVARRV